MSTRPHLIQITATAFAVAAAGLAVHAGREHGESPAAADVRHGHDRTESAPLVHPSGRGRSDRTLSEPAREPAPNQSGSRRMTAAQQTNEIAKVSSRPGSPGGSPLAGGSSSPRFRPVDPLAPGNALPVQGGTVMVRAFRSTPDTGAPELELQVSSLDLLSPSSAAPSGAVPSHPSGASQASVNRPGLTYEQELFRTKWGWAAFERAQREGF